MSIDYNAIIMFGKEFDSFSDASEYLLENGHITEAEADEAEYNREFENFDWQIYSHYESCAGVLGCEVTAEELWLSNDLCGRDFDKVLAILGDGCALFSFVQAS